MQLSKDFLWGGAVSAHQVEGGYGQDGKGTSIADVLTAGTNTAKRRITDGVLPGEYYPNHDAIRLKDFYKEDMVLFM